MANVSLHVIDGKANVLLPVRYYCIGLDYLYFKFIRVDSN